MRTSGWGDGDQNLLTGMILSNEYVFSYSTNQTLTPATPWAVLDILPPSFNVSSIGVIRTATLC
jgi:hypothetical protein